MPDRVYPGISKEDDTYVGDGCSRHLTLTISAGKKSPWRAKTFRTARTKYDQQAGKHVLWSSVGVEDSMANWRYSTGISLRLIQLVAI